jgi:hypothetical protein
MSNTYCDTCGHAIAMTGHLAIHTPNVCARRRREDALLEQERAKAQAIAERDDHTYGYRA